MSAVSRQQEKVLQNQADAAPPRESSPTLLDEIMQHVLADSKCDSQSYLRETDVPHGGE